LLTVVKGAAPAASFCELRELACSPFGRCDLDFLPTFHSGG
jgi:hypothetical protein